MNYPDQFGAPGGRLAWWLAVALATGVSGAAVASAPRATQGPTFRASVDVIAVDVQVLGRDGRPMAELGPAAFSVTIDGKERRVMSVDRVQYATSPTGAGDPSTIQIGPSATNEWPASGPVARTFLLALDTSSFGVADSRRAAEAARAFVDHLQPNDLVGVYSYPIGPRIAPSSDRAAVRKTLDAVVGGGKALTSQFHLTPAEVIDINAELASSFARQPASAQAGRGGQLAPTLASGQNEILRRVQVRECGGETDLQCAENIEREAQNLAFYYEVEITRTVNDLGALIRSLGDLPGRKTVVVLSAGMPLADRPGGRPTVSDLARVLGEEAARANASIYALHLDSSFFQAFAAETRKASRNPISQARESIVMGRFLDEFASSSGGTMIRVVVGSGEGALSQILMETSAYYLLGVAPATADRDGRTHKLRVRVDAKGATVRSRTWVHVPKRPPA